MAFNSDNLGCLGSYSGGKVWSYNTSDLLATVLADDYFSSVSAQLAVGDIVKLESQDGSGIKHYGEIVFTGVSVTVTTRPIYARHQIPMLLGNWREIAGDAIQNLAAHGGLLASDSDPTLQFENGATDSTWKASWAASSVAQIAIQVPLPPDYYSALALTLRIVAKMDLAGGSIVDTPVMNAKFYMDGIATAANAKTTGATGAISTDEYAEYSVDIDPSYIDENARTVTVILYPGAHTTDALDLCAVWLDAYK